MPSQQRTDLQVNSKAESKTNPCYKHRHKRKLVNNLGITNQHDILEKFKKLISVVKDH